MFVSKMTKTFSMFEHLAKPTNDKRKGSAFRKAAHPSPAGSVPPRRCVAAAASRSAAPGASRAAPGGATTRDLTTGRVLSKGYGMPVAAEELLR